MDEALFAIVKQVGPVAALLLFFVYRDKQREERLGSRLDQMQDRYANTMETIVKDNTTAMQSMAKAAEATAGALAANTEAVNRLRDAIRQTQIFERK